MNAARAIFFLCHCRRFALGDIGAAMCQARPSDARQFVGQRNNDNVFMRSLQQPAHPPVSLAMPKHLDIFLREAGATPEWKKLSRDLDGLRNVRFDHRSRDRPVCTDATPNVAAA
jgi:hypothetical protein